MSNEVDKVTRRDALKRFGAAGVAVSATAGIGASAAGAHMRPRKVASKGTVNYFTYSVYSTPSLFTEFTKQTGIKVTASNYGEEEEARGEAQGNAR